MLRQDIQPDNFGHLTENLYRGEVMERSIFENRKIRVEGKVKTIQSILNINGECGLELFCDAFIDGKKVKTFKCHSFVGNFIQVLYQQMGGIAYTNLTMYDTANASRILDRWSTSRNFFVSEYETTSGLWVGTGTTPVTINDYALATRIAHGSGSGQLNHGTNTVVAVPVYDPVTNSVQLTLTRTFANASGGSITVNEIGLVVQMNVYPSTYRFLMARDIIAGGIEILNGSTLTLNYRPTVTMSSNSGFLIAFLGILYRQFCATALSIPNTVNVGISNAESEGHLNCAGAGGLDQWAGGTNTIAEHCVWGENLGVVVGTGVVAPTANDYSLGTKIAHGYTTGKLVHHGGLVDNFSIVGATASFTIERLFHNVSGGTIVVSEMGLNALAYDRFNAFAIAKSLLGSSVSVLDGEILRALCTISQTV
jgi:hypothetical protein